MLIPRERKVEGYTTNGIDHYLTCRKRKNGAWKGEKGSARYCDGYGLSNQSKTRGHNLKRERKRGQMGVQAPLKQKALGTQKSRSTLRPPHLRKERSNSVKKVESRVNPLW